MLAVRLTPSLMPRHCKLFGKKNDGAPGRHRPRTGPQSSRPATSLLAGPRGPAGASARPPPAVPRRRQAPARTLRTAPEPAGAGGCVLRAGEARCRRPRANASARGAARERPVSHRPQHGVGRRPRRRHLPAPQTARRPRRQAPESFASPLPARQGRAHNQPRASPTRPGAGGGDGSEGPTPRRPGRRARTLPVPPPQSPRVCAASGPAQAARSGRGGRADDRHSRSQVTPPPLQSNPTTAAGAGLSPARARARRRPHARRERSGTSTPTPLTPPPFLACSLAPPVRPARRARGGGASVVDTPT